MQVKVWNENDYEYRETFKDQDIRIPARGFVEMEFYDAHELLGTYKPIQKDGNDQPLPQSFKMLRVEKDKNQEVDPKLEANKCIACSFRGGSAKELFDHTLSAHAHQVIVDDEAEKAIGRKKRA